MCRLFIPISERSFPYGLANISLNRLMGCEADSFVLSLAALRADSSNSHNTKDKLPNWTQRLAVEEIAALVGI